MNKEICPKFEKATKILYKRWNGLIIHQLLGQTKRFNELQAEINLSGKVLSQRLKELEKIGVVERVVYAETPVRIEYKLTQMGESLRPMIAEIQKWSTEWL
jgi:DNA-binding HxlR family transcriptional regulator